MFSCYFFRRTMISIHRLKDLNMIISMNKSLLDLKQNCDLIDL